MLAWACAIGILGLSASLTCSSEFFYSHNPFQRFDECNLCFEKDCLTLDNARCDYYAEADSILPALLKDEVEPGVVEDDPKRKEVDDLMFELVGKVLSDNMECIPYISRYTNCNKDNVCLGCKTCVCNPEGKWNCTAMQPCHNQDPPLNIDHRFLLMIIEALSENTHPRKTKRSVTDNPKNTASTITLEQLSEWLYGAKPLHVQEISPTDIKSTTDFIVTMPDDEIASEIASTTVPVPTEETGSITNGDTGYVAFDEVLRSIAVDPKTYNRRKPLDNIINNKTFSVDYMNMDEENITNGTPNEHLGDVINFMLDYDAVVTESTVASTTELMIDLLETAGRLGANVNVTEDYTNYNNDEDLNIFDNTNDIIQYNALNIMKREVIGQEKITAPNTVPTVTIIVNTTYNTSYNKTEETTDLKEHVLIPLNKIISDKIRELENLQRIKQDLQNFLKSDNQPEDIPKENNTASNTYFSIYNVAMPTGLDVDLKRGYPSRYEKHMLKLKSDIFEVIRDIFGIQKYKNSELPEDLKLLMHAMKRYVYQNHEIQSIEKPKSTRRQNSFRRNIEHSRTSLCDRLSFNDCLVQVIKEIDKDMPKSNALSPLSPATRKIMKHVIKSYYADQFVIPGLREHDPHYDLTNYLNSIGSTWPKVTANLTSSTPFATLHRMKLLLCTLTLDISKMNEAIVLIEFAQSRRMVASIGRVSDYTLDRIDAGLTAIHNKIMTLVKYYKRKPKPPVRQQQRAEIRKTTYKPRPLTTIKTLSDISKKKKHSFIKHIRNLLKNSKNDIAELLHRKVPKSEIVRQLAKKRLDEISEKRYGEYEETMRRWQHNLELASRMKRSVLDQFQSRIKNIIPGYLRYKVNPRIKENHMNATADATRKADDRKKKRKERKSSRRERKARKTTTPRSRKPTTPKTRSVTRPTIHAPATRNQPLLQL